MSEIEKIKYDPQPDRDPALELLILSIEDAEDSEEIPSEHRNPAITLTVGGLVISGKLIGVKRFNELFWGGFYKTLFEGTGPKEPDEPDPNRRFIHLKDVRIVFPNAGGGLNIFNADVWRGRLTSVDGFMMGQYGEES